MNLQPTGTLSSHSLEFASDLVRQHTTRSTSAISLTTAQEIAWRLLLPFIHVADCNVQTAFFNTRTNEWDTYRGPMNRRETFTDLINGRPVRASYFTRKCFQEHTIGISRYFYRSRYNARYSTGFGGYAHAYKDLPFDADRFGLKGKKITDPATAILLLGLDIDAHDGEQDVHKTLNMLLEFFPGSYFEPSTNGTGIHLYLKFKYPIDRCGSSHGTLRYVFDLCADLGRLLDRERLDRGYDAPLDRIRGLPTLITLDRDEKQQPIILKSVLPDGTTKKRYKLRIYCRSEVIKVPFFRGCSMEAVTWFYDAPWVDLDNFESIHTELAGCPYYGRRNDIMALPEVLEDQLVEDLLGSEEPIEIEAEEDNSIVCGPEPRLRQKDYQQAVGELVTTLDSNERRFEFCLLYCQWKGRLAEVSELIREYRRAGLALPRSRSDNHPVVFESRIQAIRDWMATRFDPAKVRFNYRQYPDHRSEAEAIIRSSMAGINLECHHGKRRKELTVEHLAALYWSLGHSQGHNASTRFSQKQARDAVLETIGDKMQTHEITAAFRALRAMGLIEKMGNYLAGYQATEWRVK